MIVSANSIVQLAIQITNRIIKHVNVNVKLTVPGRKIIAGILPHVLVRMISI